MAPPFLPAALLLQLGILLSTAKGSRSNDCPSSWCGDMEIKFPFNLETSSKSCRAAGLNARLSCSSANQTILTLPSSQSYIVTYFGNINQYLAIQLRVYFSSSCSWLKGLAGKPPNTTGSIFSYSLNTKYVLVNCTNKLNWDGDKRPEIDGPISCLSELGPFVYSVSIYAAINIIPPRCTTLTTGELFSDDGFIDFEKNNMTGSSTLPQLLEINGKSQGCFDCTKRGRECGYNIKKENVLCIDLGDSNQVYVGVILMSLWDAAKLKFALFAVICRFVIAPLCLLAFLVYKISQLFVPSGIVEKFLKYQEAGLSPKRYSYNEIVAMTSNFKEKIGEGGFGSVFKGKHPDGYLIAVKMMGKTLGDGEDFINEVSTIGRIHHVNVVQLIGFCVEGPNTRALVYEYMANGSLDKHIFNSNSNGTNRFLSAEKLHEIAKSVAKGLNYLHQGCNMRILHFDIKPHNILLDHKFTPKISDFGLAKLYPKGYSIVSISDRRGTLGYIAPELVSRSFGEVSHKSDVYSFGMLLMDMAGGRKHADMNAKNLSQVYYPSWIYDKLLKIEELNHMERTEIYEAVEIGDVERMLLCKVGLWCIQMSPSDRPSMSRVVEMLEANDINSLQMPPKPFFSTSDSAPSINIYMNSSQSELSVISEE